ncbi:FAD-dependent monooxygenase [Actinoplanes sp. NBC_00393]|uniref:FAD-dependent oxidoreductase n=1 Tax=Actinoplanes sp. NBC_00393 TaxID=2975953 RepID=UPI002E20F7BB
MIAIVGAGIAGLTAALALARRNVGCVVFERGDRIPDEGAGIQLSPNAAAELLDLGVRLDDAIQVGQRELRRWQDDTVLTRTGLDRYPVPYFTMRRGALVAALRQAPVRLDHRCTAVHEDGTIELAGGATERFDAVIGADGLHSATRALFRAQPPRDSGFVAHRAVLPLAQASAFTAPDRVVVWLGPGRNCVAYPIGADRLNLVVVTPGDDPRSSFTGWNPAVRGLISLAAGFDRRTLYDRAPLPAWHQGRVVLAGDAAHPMLPFIAQGAAQAIEDAVTLAGCLGGPDAFARYHAARRDRVQRVFELSRAGSRVHLLPDGPEQRDRDRALAAASPGSHDWLYGHRA